MDSKNKSMLLLYVLLDAILIVALVCTYNEFGLSTLRDQIFLIIMGLLGIIGIGNTIRFVIKIKRDS